MSAGDGATESSEQVVLRTRTIDDISGEPTELLVQVQKRPAMETNETVIQVMREPETLDESAGGYDTNDPSLIDTVVEGPNGKKAYLQRYRPAWEEVEMFREWLIPVSDDPFSAACASCECSMKAHRQVLIEHAKSKKHLSMMGKRNPDYRPSPSPRMGRGRGGSPARGAARGAARGRKRHVSPGAGEAPPGTPYKRMMNIIRSDDTEAELEVSYSDSSRVTYAIGLGSQRVGFIGSGSAARAIAKGMLDKGLVVPGKVLVSAPSDRNFETWKRWGCRTTFSNDVLMRSCDIVFLAVKPSVLEPLVNQLDIIAEDRSRCVITLVTGVSRERVSALLASRRQLQTDMAELHVVRCQPSTPLMIGEGCCSYAAASDLPHHWLLAVETIFSALGMCHKVDEGIMDALAGAFSSGPAFVYSFVEALSTGAVNMGVPWHLARPMAAQTVLGAARMLMETGCTAAELRDDASSPGGTTPAGLMAMEKEGMRYAVMAAVRAATERSRELGQTFSQPDPLSE